MFRCGPVEARIWIEIIGFFLLVIDSSILKSCFFSPLFPFGVACDSRNGF